MHGEMANITGSEDGDQAFIAAMQEAPKRSDLDAGMWRGINAGQ